MLLTCVWLVFAPTSLSSLAACPGLACCIHLHMQHRVDSENKYALMAAFIDNSAIYRVVLTASHFIQQPLA